MVRLSFLLLTILFGLAGCTLLSSDDDDEVERTYPRAFDLEMVKINELRNDIPPPDSLNIEAFVVSRIICPEGAACFLPDGIVLAEAPNDTARENQLFLSVAKPQQFDEDKQYTLSVSVRTNSNGERKFFDLLGYTKNR